MLSLGRNEISYPTLLQLPFNGLVDHKWIISIFVVRTDDVIGRDSTFNFFS